MHFLFKKNLSEDNLFQIKKIFKETDFSSSEQYPGFAEAAYPDERIVYVIAELNEKIIGYAVLKINGKIIASVYFGPFVKNESDFYLLIVEIKKYCKRNFIPILRIFPSYNSKDYQASFRERIEKKLGAKSSINTFNWATLLLNINFD